MATLMGCQGNSASNAHTAMMQEKRRMRSVGIPLILEGGGSPVVRVAVLEPPLDSSSLRETQLADSSMSWVVEQT